MKTDSYNSPSTIEKKCRFSGVPLKTACIDLGVTPLANSYLSEEDLDKEETFYPLKTYISEDNFLLQLPVNVSAQNIFSNYAYYSSYSKSWLTHSQKYSEMITKKLNLTEKSLVIEVASNDGYLLQYFKMQGIPVLGVEPAQNVAHFAIEKGIETEVSFFGKTVAKNLVLKKCKADLLIANNVLAHVPDINDFVAGIKIALKDDGVFTGEFPHLLKTIQNNEFDTIYHEHFSYFSFMTISKIFAHHEIRIFDVEELPTHGGSIRIYGCHAHNEKLKNTENTTRILAQEKAAGLDKIQTYLDFGHKVKEIKRNILSTLIELKNSNKTIAGYGAPAKGNTLLNYCGIGTDFLDYTVDLNPHKVGKYLPGTRIPIKNVEYIKQTKPDYVLILPWNLKDEIKNQISFIKEWGGKFIIPIPKIVIED